MKLKALMVLLAGRFMRFAPFNLAAIAMATVILLSIHDVLGNKVELSLLLGLGWGAMAGMACQLVGEWREASWLRISAWPVTVVCGALGFGLVHVATLSRPGLCAMVYSGVSVALAAGCVALLYRIANEKTLISHLVWSVVGALNVIVVFACGLDFCLRAFGALVAEIPSVIHEDVFAFSVFAFVPVIVSILLPHKVDAEEDGEGCGDMFNGITEFFSWILLPVALLLLAILYFYLVRILVVREMPSGELNWFGSVAIAAYVFFWLTLRDSTCAFFRRFARWGWALLVPVLAAQIVGIVIRYNAYGLSAPRFVGMIALALGIFALVLAAFNRRPRVLFPVIACVGLVFTVTPLNVFDVPIRNQEARLQAALARNGVALDGDLKASRPISAEDAEIIKGAWDYLEDMWSAYYRSAVVSRIEEKLGETSLPVHLGLAERRESCDFSASNVTICFAGDGTWPAAGYAHLRAVGWHCVERCDQRYYLNLKTSGKDALEKFDVTEHVAHLCAAAGWDGVIPATNATYQVSAASALWELRPGMTLVLFDPEIRFNGAVGRASKSFIFCRGAVLGK